MTLQGAILQTLAYSDHFSFPLTVDEIHPRLLGFSTTRKHLIKHLNIMVKVGQIAQTGKYFYLPGKNKLVHERQNRAKSTAPKWELAQKYASHLSRVPGVVAIYLTGSLAVQNAKNDDDLDFMVITKPERLWLTRLFVTFYCELLGIRRRPKVSSASNQLCLNLYLTTTSLNIPDSKHSLYTAYELIQAVPLYDPIGTQALLFQNNSWLSSYLPNFHMPTFPNLPSMTYSLSPITSFLDFLAYKLQLFYMRHKITCEYITRDSAFFHPHSPGRDIMGVLKVSPSRLTR